MKKKNVCRSAKKEKKEDWKIVIGLLVLCHLVHISQVGLNTDAKKSHHFSKMHTKLWHWISCFDRALQYQNLIQMDMPQGMTWERQTYVSYSSRHGEG
jgi:D-alanyl-lipoteichoic acid acyltransferase DltB (MBOAT superfamily)